MAFVTITHFLAMKLTIQKGVWKLGIFLYREFCLKNNNAYSNRERRKVTFLHLKSGKRGFKETIWRV